MLNSRSTVKKLLAFIYRSITKLENVTEKKILFEIAKYPKSTSEKGSRRAFMKNGIKITQGLAGRSNRKCTNF